MSVATADQNGLMPFQVIQPPIGGLDLRRPTLVHAAYIGMPRNSGWAHALPQRAGPWPFPTQSGLPSNLSCTRHTHTQVLLHAIAIPLTVLNTAITFDWRICQYFSQEEVYCRTSKVNIEDDMCAKLGNINRRCNEAVFLETTRI